MEDLLFHLRHRSEWRSLLLSPSPHEEESSEKEEPKDCDRYDGSSSDHACGHVVTVMEASAICIRKGAWVASDDGV